MFACFAAGRIASACLLVVKARLPGEGISLDSLRDLSRGWTVESESVRPLASGDDESWRLSFSCLRGRPVLDLSLTGLATESAYLVVPSMMLSESSASSTEATLIRLDDRSVPDIARPAGAVEWVLLAVEPIQKGGVL